MLALIFKQILPTLAISLTLILILYQILCYARLNRYTKQKILTIFYPIIGNDFRVLKYLNKTDLLQGVKKLVKENPKEDFLIYNNGMTSKCTIHLISSSATKEFASKELDVSSKKLPADLEVLSFFFRNGAEAMKNRAIFAEIFHYDNLARMCPKIHKCINKNLDSVLARIKAAPKGQITMDLREQILKPLVKEISYLILLGRSSNPPKTKEGQELYEIVQIISKNFLKIFLTSFLNKLSFGWLEKFGILNEKKIILSEQKKLKKMVEREFASREDFEPGDTPDNFFDILKKYNSKKQNKPLTIKEITGHIELFQFAASDTSLSASSSLCTYLARNPQKQKNLAIELLDLSPKKNLEVEELESYKYLDMCAREGLRMMPPAYSTTQREIKKNSKFWEKNFIREI